MTLGLVPAPELPERIAHGVAGELPGFLGERVDGTVSWEVPVVVDPLTGSERDTPELPSTSAGSGCWKRGGTWPCT